MIIDFFASLSFYIIPYLIGRLFTKNIVISWLLGAFSLFIIFFALFGVTILFKINFSLFVFIAVVGLSLVSLFRLLLDVFKSKTFIKPGKEITFMLILSSLVYFLIWKRSTPYPLALNWDMYEHIALADLIAQGKLSILSTKISDTFTFNSYSPIFQILLSIPKIIFQRSLLGVYWWLEYWHYLLTIIASFWLAKKFFNNKLIALLSALISALVFESTVAYSPLFLIPQTLAALLTVFLMGELKGIKLRFLALSTFVILLMHYIVGFVCIIVLGCIYWTQNKISLKRINWLILASALILVALALLNLKAQWQILGIEEAGHFSFSLWQKLGFLADWYGIGLIIGFIVGFISILRSSGADKKIVLIIALLILGLSLAPFSYFLKFYVLGGYFVNCVLALGLFILLSNLSRIWKILSFSWVILFLVLTFYKNQLIYKDPLRFGNFEAQLSLQEIETGKWLVQNEKADTFLISDPATQYVLEALSGINTQGGVYMSLQTRQKLILINGSRDPIFIRQKLLEIKDELGTPVNRETLFAIGGRYFAWQSLPEEEKNSSFYNIWSPKIIKLEDEAFVDFLNKSPGFKLIYKNNELNIFKII